MDLEDFRSQLEEEHTWRQDELRFFSNQCSNIESEQQQEQFRRAQVLLLYSHFEGFCKFALSLYVNAINQAGVRCVDACPTLIANSISDVFGTLRNGEKKAKEFKRELPDDSKLHRFALEVEFIERTADIMQRPLEIPDNAIDLESNLKPVVLRKNLFRLGLPYAEFKKYEGQIHKLLEFRNKIAHGETKLGIDRKTYDELSRSAFSIITEVTQLVTKAFGEKHFLADEKKPA